MRTLFIIIASLSLSSCFAQPGNPKPSNPDSGIHMPGNPKPGNPDKPDTITTVVKLSPQNINDLKFISVKADTLKAQIERVKKELRIEEERVILQSIDSYGTYNPPIKGTLVKYTISKDKIIVKSIPK